MHCTWFWMKWLSSESVLMGFCSRSFEKWNNFMNTLGNPPWNRLISFVLLLPTLLYGSILKVRNYLFNIVDWNIEIVCVIFQSLFQTSKPLYQRLIELNGEGDILIPEGGLSKKVRSQSKLCDLITLRKD